MHNINTVDNRSFSLNGIKYLKNYISSVHGNRVKIFNCYENKDVLVELDLFSQFSVNGITYGSAAALQAALLNLCYARVMGDGDVVLNQDNIGRVVNIGNCPLDYPEQLYIFAFLSKLNSITTTILEHESPVIIRGYVLDEFYIATFYTFLWMGGKGTFGSEGTQVVYNMLYEIPTVSQDAYSVVLDYGDINTTISEWLNVQNGYYMHPQEEGYIIIRGSINGLSTEYLWIGGSGLYGEEGLQSTDEDFQVLSSQPLYAPEQDNILIVKKFNYSDASTPQQILGNINGLGSYTVNDFQSVLFKGINLFNSNVVKYLMVNKGKGTYGYGGIQLTLQDVELVYTSTQTVEDIEQEPSTESINFDSENVWEWLNIQNPQITIQPQNEGYTLLTSETSNYLFTGEPGTYGEGGLQSTSGDFELLNNINNNITLGETELTAYRGDRGKLAFDHSQDEGNPHNAQIADIPGLQTALNTIQASKLNIGANTGLAGTGLRVPVISENGTISAQELLTFLNVTRELVIGNAQNTGKLTVYSQIFELAVQDNITSGQSKVLFNTNQDDAFSFADKSGKVYMTFRSTTGNTGVIYKQREIFDQQIFYPVTRLQASITSAGAGVKVYGKDANDAVITVPFATDTTIMVLEASLLVKNATASHVIAATIRTSVKRVSGTIIQTTPVVQIISTHNTYTLWTFGVEAVGSNLQFYFTPDTGDTTAYTGAFTEIKYSIN